MFPPLKRELKCNRQPGKSYESQLMEEVLIWFHSFRETQVKTLPTFLLYSLTFTKSNTLDLTFFKAGIGWDVFIATSYKNLQD